MKKRKIIILLLVTIIPIIGCNEKKELSQKKIEKLYQLAQDGENKKISEYSAQLLKEFPQKRQVIRAVTEGYLASGNIEKAFTTITKALLIEKDLAFTLEILALCYLANGERKKAIEIAKLSATLTLLIKEREEKEVKNE